MKYYDVTVEATIIKTVRVFAASADDAEEIAHEEFDVRCEGPDERYDQQTRNVTEVPNQGETP